VFHLISYKRPKDCFCCTHTHYIYTRFFCCWWCRASKRAPCSFLPHWLCPRQLILWHHTLWRLLAGSPQTHPPPPPPPPTDAARRRSPLIAPREMHSGIKHPGHAKWHNWELKELCSVIGEKRVCKCTDGCMDIHSLAARRFSCYTRGVLWCCKVQIALWNKLILNFYVHPLKTMLVKQILGGVIPSWSYCLKSTVGSCKIANYREHLMSKII
jgi:hypothetical protein